MTTTNLSKAAQKRLDDTKIYFTNVLNNRLIDFKNKYLQDYSDWTIFNLEMRLAQIKDSTPAATKYISLSTAIQSKESGIKMLEGKLSRKALIQLEAMTEANKSFNVRLENLVSKMIEFGMSTNFLKIEKISNDFSFLISNNEMEIHARVIYACGAINCPHYRFITTKRMK